MSSDYYYLITTFVRDRYLGGDEANDEAELSEKLSTALEVCKAKSKETHLTYSVGVGLLSRSVIFSQHLADYIIIEGGVMRLTKDENGEGHMEILERIEGV